MTRKKNDPGKAAPAFDALLTAKAADDPRAWEAMLNLNKMRAAQRKAAREEASVRADGTDDD